MKEEIKKALEGCESATLAEIYEMFPDKSKDSVRGTVNLMYKNGDILRVSTAKYALDKNKKLTPVSSGTDGAHGEKPL